MKNLVIIENRSELGAGTRGASLGIDALKIAAVTAGSKFFAELPRLEIQDQNHLLYNRVRRKFAKRIEGIVKVYQRLSELVKRTLLEQKFPLVLSGDHSSAGGTIAGIKAAFPDKRLGVVWVDAHADMHTPYTSPSGNVHGMPLATATNEDNLDKKKKEPSEETMQMWETLKATAVPGKKVEYSDIVFIGLRDYEDEEEYLIEKNKVKVFTSEEMHREGAEIIGKATLDYLKDCDILYISFDVDSMDSLISEGTGTPVPEGLWPDEARDLLLELCNDERVCCLEITEINPLLDQKNTMAEVAFDILEAVGNKLRGKTI
jgi:arginase